MTPATNTFKLQTQPFHYSPITIKLQHGPYV